MKRLTKAERIIRYLKEKGCSEVTPSRSRKYRQFQHKAGETYWIGRNGAFRVGKNSSNSIPVNVKI